MVAPFLAVIQEKSFTWNHGAMTFRLAAGLLDASTTEAPPAMAMSASPLVTTRSVLPPPPPE